MSINTAKQNFLRRTILALTVGFLSSIALTFPHQALNAQPALESNVRPAIVSENDRLYVHSLIKSSLISLNQANLTNNYSVLRELGSPAFQANNSVENLGEIFAGIREANLDFAVIVENSPVFDIEPTLDNQNNLRVQGYFPTSPRIEFELVYQPINGKFLIDVFSVAIVPNS